MRTPEGLPRAVRVFDRGARPRVAPSAEERWCSRRSSCLSQRALGAAGMPDDADGFGEFAVLTVVLEMNSTFLELVESEQALQPNLLPSKALTERIQLLERFFAYVNSHRAEAEAKISMGKRREQREAIAEFAASLGLVINEKPRKQIKMLVRFAEVLIESEFAPEFARALLGGDSADIPLEVRVEAVATVQHEFGIKDWGAARRALTNARGAHPFFKHLPIPGGDVGP